MALDSELSVEDYERYVVLLSTSKLKTSVRTSTLLAGFALVGIAEAEIHFDTPAAIIIPYAMHTALLIFVHLISIVIATQILPELEAVKDNPHLTLHCRGAIKLAKSWPVQLSWFLSNVIGIAMFAVELVLVAYVRFFPVEIVDSKRLHAGTGTLLTVFMMTVLSMPAIIVSARSVSKQKIRFHEQRLRGAQELLDNINQASAVTAPDVGDIEAAYYASGSFDDGKVRDTEV